MQSDGGELSSCINATTLAFMDAGIPIKNLLCACTAAFVYSRTANDMIANIQPQLLLDVNNTELSRMNRSVCLNLALQGNTNDAVMWSLERGKVTSDVMSELFHLATKGCHIIRNIVHEYCHKIYN
uniref:Exosome complex component ski6 (Trinotate prediction) n=1 Tax=Henneguya salminicola TaxID=69463 RepID=A0A6G3MLI2_HENSL